MDTAELNAASRAQAAVHGARPRRHPFLGGLLVKDRLINETQLDRVLALQQETEPRPLLGQLLVDQKLITPHELNTVLGKYRREHLLGDILVETNLLTPAQLEAALVGQRRTGVPLGETLIQLGYITERQLKNALSIQLRIAFVDLDRRSIDPELATVISERYARRHRAIPIARDDDRIVLAMDDPTDADVVAEVRSCTGCRIDVATATADTLERALSRLYGDRGELGTAHPPTAAAHSEKTARARRRRPSRRPAPTVTARALRADAMPARGATATGQARKSRSMLSGRRWRPSGSGSGTGSPGSTRSTRCCASASSSDPGSSVSPAISGRIGPRSHRRGRSSTRGSRLWPGSRWSIKPCYATGRPSRAP